MSLRSRRRVLSWPRLSLLVLVLPAALLFGVPRRAPAVTYDVVDIKAALVGKVADFVRWPDDAGLGDPERPFELVVLGRTPLEDRLRELYERRRVRIGGRRVWVRHADEVRDIGRPHLLFLAPSLRDEVEMVITALGQRPILVMADTAGWAKRGVAVNFVEAGNRVRFEISRAALARHRLNASFRLLAMASLVGEGAEP